MKTIIITLCLVATSAFAKEMKTELKPLTGTELTHVVSQLDKQDQKLDGKFVRVQGKVTDSCPMAGCWIELQDLKTASIIKVKVKDGEIVFGKDTHGKTVTVEGKLVAKKLSKSKAIKHFKHLAEEKNQKFDPSTVKGDMVIWQIEGTAAQIN